jgi:sec-independent protein translocase protein TatB
MFDIAPTELMMVALVALVVIGPKDLPKLMRTVGYWVGRARGVARHFRSGMDEMMRQAEIDEMEKRWAAENERIMREHPASDIPAATTEQPYTAPLEGAPYTDETMRQPTDAPASVRDAPPHSPEQSVDDSGRRA